MQFSSNSNQKNFSLESIISLLSNRYSRTILMTTQDNPKSVLEISEENDFPIGSVYRSINDLAENGFLTKTGTLNIRGRKYYQYRSTLKSIHLKLDKQSIDFVTLPNIELEGDQKIGL